MDWPTLVLTLCVIAFTALAAFIDWRWGKIPNWLTVSCFACALVFHFVVGLFGWSLFGWDGADGGWMIALTRLMWAVLGFATGFGILLVLWLTAGGMGGDVKLMGAIGAWLMPTMTLYVFLVTCLLVALLMAASVSWKVLNGQWKETRRDLGKDRTGAKAKNAPKRGITRFGVPMAVATWGVLMFQLILGK